MCWKLIQEGPYQPFHQLTYASPSTAVGCFAGTRSAEPATASQNQAAGEWGAVPSWLPVITTVIEALEPFQEASRAVTQAIMNRHPEQFPPEIPQVEQPL